MTYKELTEYLTYSEIRKLIRNYEVDIPFREYIASEDSIDGVVLGAFVWSKSREGREYWSKIFWRVQDNDN